MKGKRNVLWILITVCIFSSCQFQLFDNGGNEILKEYYNPQGSLKVVFFEKPGNATVRNSIHASIQDYDYKLTSEEIGNIFIANQFEFINKAKDSLILVNWIDNETVHFVYPKNIQTFKKEEVFDSNLGKVKVSYKSVEK